MGTSCNGCWWERMGGPDGDDVVNPLSGWFQGHIPEPEGCEEWEKITNMFDEAGLEEYIEHLWEAHLKFCGFCRAEETKNAYIPFGGA